MSAYEMGVQAAISTDNKKRQKDPLAYDKSTLQRMAAVFDLEVKKHAYKVEKIKTRMGKRAALAGKKGLVSIFKKLAHDINHAGLNRDESCLLGSASIFSSSCFNVQPSLATSYTGLLDNLKATDEYKNLLLAARKNDVYIAITTHSYGVTLDIDVTKTFGGSPDAKLINQTKPQPLPKSTP